MTIASPSNFPTVYMLDVPTVLCPSLASQTVNFPPPLSGPVALNSISVSHAEYFKLSSAHIPPLWFPGAGGVKITLFERIWGIMGSPMMLKCGTFMRSCDILRFG
jgi:hypothetical protein